MSVLINASTSAGAQITPDNSGVLQFQSNGANTVAIAANGTITTPAGTVVATANGSVSTSGQLIRGPQVLTSGTSYTTPAGCNSIYVELVGGGGGTSRSSGSTAGGNTTFTVANVTITGNGGAASSSIAAANGGSASGGDINLTGNRGNPAFPSGTPGIVIGIGGQSLLLNGGIGSTGQSSAAGNDGAGGGGSGGYSAKYFSVSPNTAYTYAIGAAGTSVSANLAASNGLIRVWEFT